MIRHALAEAATQNPECTTEDGKWTRKAVIESARAHSTLTAWRKPEVSAYVIAYPLGRTVKATGPMTRAELPNSYWTVERKANSSRRLANAQRGPKVVPASRTSRKMADWCLFRCRKRIAMLPTVPTPALFGQEEMGCNRNTPLASHRSAQRNAQAPLST